MYPICFADRSKGTDCGPTVEVETEVTGPAGTVTCIDLGGLFPATWKEYAKKCHCDQKIFCLVYQDYITNIVNQ